MYLAGLLTPPSALPSLLCHSPDSLIPCVQSFLTDDVHKALAACSSMRPPVDISVAGDSEESTEGVGVGGARTEYRSTVAAA